MKKVKQKVETVKANSAGLKRAIAVLRAGGIIVFPTETSYGIAADATNSKAVAKVYVVKRRSRVKSLPIIVSNVAMAEKYLQLNPLAQKFLKFFPAPLTLVVPLKKNSKLARNLTSNKKVAFRVPAHDFSRALAAKLQRPVTSTSANCSGKKPLFSPHNLALPVDLIVDAGKLKEVKPSTIVDCTSREARLIRRGSFSRGLNNLI